MNIIVQQLVRDAEKLHNTHGVDPLLKSMVLNIVRVLETQEQDSKAAFEAWFAINTAAKQQEQENADVLNRGKLQTGRVRKSNQS